ncbi:hypothetical protein GCM10011578_083860 [Streptomyces fuscichromogenes]|uniref:Uncharacterized protein n=1 Tax=Streptomyces fuscichromogenes TaxID=1324013 RepID=A0A917XM48_9ACTN|nr:hypothetical protein GCM10011578_083860 [Streptomyces fuscichromogenes]
MRQHAVPVEVQPPHFARDRSVTQGPLVVVGEEPQHQRARGDPGDGEAEETEEAEEAREVGWAAEPQESNSRGERDAREREERAAIHQRRA